MDEDFSKVQKRAIQYWFIDGLAELAAGLVSLFLAVLFLIWQAIFYWRWSLPVILVGGLAVSFGIRLIIQRMKERTTYPRTGYASPLSGMESKWSVVIVVAFTVFLLGANYYLSIIGRQGLLWSPALAGLAFAFLFAWTGVVTKLRRFFPLAVFSLCLGVILAAAGLIFFKGVGVLAGCVGLVLLYQGYRIRRTYLQQHPASGEEIDE